jgi:cell wall-associated NlpC family hydrolase
MSRILAISAVFAVLVAPASAQTGSGAAYRADAPDWAKREIRIVVSHGLMAKSIQAFKPNSVLTRVALSGLVAGLNTTGQTPPPTAASSTPATIAELDSALVSGLDLRSAAAEFTAATRAAGLKPPSRFGTEVVARLLGLRTNHPAQLDSLELRPSDPATRAEAAYSAAQILGFSGWETHDVEDAAAGFQLPTYTPWQKRILSTAVRFIGYPYVWGGTTESVESPFGIQAVGGFDCSGFVWRVYKLQAYTDAAGLSSTLKGRTTFQMSGEVGPAKRIPFAKLKPADVLFWGSNGARSKPSQVDHTGIYLGNGWFIHSSGYGVALARLSGWYKQRFAWARRPLAEAGLS